MVRVSRSEKFRLPEATNKTTIPFHPTSTPTKELPPLTLALSPSLLGTFLRLLPRVLDTIIAQEDDHQRQEDIVL